MCKDRYGIIYKITNTKNNKVYIGQTSKSNGVNGRYHGNLLKWTHNKHLRRSILKYGEEVFNIEEEIDTAYSLDELNEKEKYWISYYNSNDYRFGYNETDGGDRFERSGFAKINHLNSMNSKPILCTTTLEIFLTINDFANKYNISKTSISSTLKNRIPRHDTIFYNDDIQNILEIITYDNDTTHNTPIICLETKDRMKNFNGIAKYLGKKITPQKYFETAERKGNKIVKICDKHFMKLYDYIVDETIKNNHIN